MDALAKSLVAFSNAWPESLNMLRIHLLVGSLNNVNTQALVYPFFFAKNELGQSGINVFVYRNLRQPSLVDCDILCLDSKFFKAQISRDEKRTITVIENLCRHVENTIWFNTADGTGNIQKNVLDVVKLYFKSQLLTNKDLYQQPLYGGRLYTDYFFKRYNITDDPPTASTTLNREQISKLRLSWNLGMAPAFSISRDITRKVFLKTNLIKSLHHFDPIPNALSKTSYSTKEGLRICGRMSFSYPRRTVSHQRQLTYRSLRKLGVETEGVSKRKYLQELRRSNLTISPFGWGEICIRDFEAFLAGSVLLKPNVGHIETYPPTYSPGQTYVPLNWDLGDLMDILADLRADNDRLTALRLQAFANFRNHLGAGGARAFSNKIQEIVGELQGQKVQGVS
jgi:hypothetical protein